MRPLGWILLLALGWASLPLASQGVMVEVIDYMDLDAAITSTPVEPAASARGLGGGAASPREVIKIKGIMSERRGGSYLLPAASGCGPLVLTWSRQATRAAVITGSAGLSYVAAVQGSYGVTDSISITAGGSFEVPSRQCGYIVGKEGLRYAEFDVYKNDKRIGSGTILYLQDVQIIKNIGIFQP